MGYTFSFEKLEVWKKAVQFSKTIYQITESFPGEEKFGMTNQLRRASISIVSNIAEGSARKSPKDQARFSSIAFSSLMESLSQIIIANELGWLDQETFLTLRTQIEELSRLLNGWHRSHISRIEEPQIPYPSDFSL